MLQQYLIYLQLIPSRRAGKQLLEQGLVIGPQHLGVSQSLDVSSRVNLQPRLWAEFDLNMQRVGFESSAIRSSRNSFHELACGQNMQVLVATHLLA